MNAVTFIATYILLWWMVFFMALPYGVSTESQIVKGQDLGAPASPNLKRKVVIVSLLTLVLCLGMHVTAPFWSPLLRLWLTDAPLS